MDGAKNCSRVLLVEDSFAFQEMVTVVLRSVDCELFVAEDGHTAKAMLEKEDFDLAILDILLPGVDGVEIARWIRGTDRTRDLPILFVTTVSDPEVKRVAKNLGSVDYLVKPVGLAVLRNQVCELLPA